MKIKVLANEIQNGAVEFVSLVKNGANRSPFKIIKMAEVPPPSWAHLMPELAKLQKRLDGNKPLSKETTEMKIKDVIGHLEPVQKDETDKVRKLEVAKLRQRLNGLNLQLANLWETPTHPLYDRLNDDLSYQIEKCELELATMTVEQQDDLMTRSSAFFRRGGVSHYADATPYDSASAQRRAELRKAESEIDLRPTITTTDEEEVAKIDLSSLAL